MSKGNMLLGYASGKVGSLVFARRLGQQVTRPYNGSPANPKTRAQMQRRIKWANIINMWRLLKPFISMGMQNRKTNQSDYNKFVSLNLNQSETYLLKDEARQGATLLAPYIVTSGSLGLRSMRSAAITSIQVGNINLTTATIGQLSAAIIANNQGIQVGDQITVFALGQELVEGIPQVMPYAFKFIITEAAADSFAIDVIETFGAVAPAVEDGFLAFEFAGVEYSSYAGCVVQSRIMADGTLAVSDSRLAVAFEVDGVQQSKNPFAVSQSEALSSYGYNPDAFLSPASTGEGSNVINPRVSSVSLDGSAIENGGEKTYTTGRDLDLTIAGTNLVADSVSVQYAGSSVALTLVSDKLMTGSIKVREGSKPLVVTWPVGSLSATIEGTSL